MDRLRRVSGFHEACVFSRSVCDCAVAFYHTTTQIAPNIENKATFNILHSRRPTKRSFAVAQFDQAPETRKRTIASPPPSCPGLGVPGGLLCHKVSKGGIAPFGDMERRLNARGGGAMEPQQALIAQPLRDIWRGMRDRA